MRKKFAQLGVARQIAACAAAYPAVYLGTFIFLVALKNAGAGAGTGTLDLTAGVISPIALLGLGFIVAGWIGVISHLGSIILVSKITAGQTEALVSIVGNRGYSYARAQNLGRVYAVGFAASIAFIIARGMLERRKATNAQGTT